jgi:hypothetical protein
VDDHAGIGGGPELLAALVLYGIPEMLAVPATLVPPVVFTTVTCLPFNLLEIGLLTVGLLEVGLLEVGLLEVGLLEVGLLEVGLLEVGSSVSSSDNIWIALSSLGRPLKWLAEAVPTPES